MSTEDPRIDIVRQAQLTHKLRSAGVQHGRTEEHWRCHCGVAYFGDGAIEKGRRHEADEILTALDQSAAVA